MGVDPRVLKQAGEYGSKSEGLGVDHWEFLVMPLACKGLSLHHGHFKKIDTKCLKI